MFFVYILQPSITASFISHEADTVSIALARRPWVTQCRYDFSGVRPSSSLHLILRMILINPPLSPSLSSWNLFVSQPLSTNVGITYSIAMMAFILESITTCSTSIWTFTLGAVLRRVRLVLRSHKHTEPSIVTCLFI